MEATGDAAPPAPVTFTGRTLSLEMGPVRLGGSGRPVMIVSRTNDANGGSAAVNYRQPRIVLEPQPRSPFGRKLEASVNESFPTTKTQTHHTLRPSVSVTSLERVHTIHHPTHRTPVAVALRHVDDPANPVDTLSRQHGALRKRPTSSESDKTTASKRTSSRVARAKKNVAAVPAGTSAPIHTARVQEPPPSVQLDHTHDLKPEQAKLFTRKPPSTRDEASQRHSFHVHERLSRIGEVETRAADETYEDTGDTPMSGWRAVDASIDYLYEDTSIDIVQLQRLVHGNARDAEKRKAVERERLQAAATELQKQRQGHNSKMIEFQHRREQIMKMSDDIRTRNKVSSQKMTKPLAPQMKKSDEALTLPTRKPPVPRLSQLGGKTKTPRPKKAESGPQTARNVKPFCEEMETPEAADQEASGASNTEDQVESQPYTHDSESIMLNNEDSAVANSTAGTASQSTAPTRVTKKRKAATTSATKTTQSHSVPNQQEEISQRRAVAREYMQIQKQTRQLLRAKMEQQRQLEEERRRLDLQRLEKTRLLELEEARKRRIRQKQRDRAAQRKRDEQQRQLEQHREDRSPSVHDTRDIMNAVEKDTENQSHRGNHASQQQFTRGASEWPSKDDPSPRSSSGAPSPRSLHRSQDEENGLLVVLSQPGPKLQKLLGLEEQTKRLAEKLQSLSQQSPASDYIDIPHRAATHHTGTQNGEMDSASASGSGEGDESDSSGSASTEMDKSDAEDDDNYTNGHSATGVRQEHFVGFEGGFPCVSDRENEIDFSSIGVQHIHVVWPRGDLEDVNEDARGNTRFEMLSSSSSSSNSSDQIMQTDSQTKWDISHSNTMPRSPKLLEESVDAYAQRLLDRSVRLQSSSFSETPNYTTRVNSAKPFQSSSRYRSDVTGTKRAGPLPARSDAELLRLIRESDDNLSVIDREARRRFRLQQDRLRQRQQEQEQLEEEELRRELHIAHHARDVVHGSSTELVSSVPHDRREELVTPDMPADSSGNLRECEKLDEILQAVKTESADLDRRDVEQIENESLEEHASPPIAAVEFWNTQLQQSGGHRAPRIVVDRTDLQAQHERALSLEDDGEDEDTARLRMLSPHTLAKRLLAAVEYHEAINDAHLQLSMIDKAQAINMVQQDTIALAQAFKEEMDDNLLTQHLVQEHAVLEEVFDSNLKQVVDQLEAVREAEQRDNQIAKTRLEEEARSARRRESAVQTEPLHQVDAGTSVRLHVEAATSTDRERLDAAVQYDVGVVVSSVAIPSDAIMTDTLVDEATSGDQESGVSDDYEQETFDQASVSSPLKILPQPEQQVPGKMATVDVGEESMVESSEEIVSEEDRASRAHSDSQNDSDCNDEIASEEFAREEEDVSENAKSESIGETANSLVEEDQAERDFESTERNSRQQSQSVSVLYEDDEFEEDASLVCPEETSQSENATGVSEDRDIVADTVLRQLSQSGSGGYEEDRFDEHDASTSGGSKPLQVTHSGFVGETSDASVSSNYGNAGEEDGDEAKSISDYVSVEYGDNLSVAASRDEVNELPSEGKPLPLENAPSAPLSVMRVLTPTIDVSRLATTVSLAPEITQSYLVQLENRKRSEEALLDLRLLALEAKLQQEMQCVVDEIARAEEGKVNDRQVHSALELRKDALQMGYLSEKANIESQKATCVSRYYQDLLAFRSLGAVTTGFAVTSAVMMGTARPLPAAPSASVPLAGAPVPPVTEPKDSESGDINEYAGDDFVASEARSEMAAESNSQHDSVPEDEVDGVDEASSAAYESDSEGVVKEADDEIRSEQGQVREEKRNDSIASAPDDTAENDQDYEEEAFASMSESATMEKQDVIEEDKRSIASAPSIVDEPDSAADAEDEVVSVADDVGLPIGSDGAAIPETSSDSNPNDVEIVSDPNELAGSAVVESKDNEDEPDETSQVYEDEEFASISEATVNAQLDSVPEDASVEITPAEIGKASGESDDEDPRDDDAVGDAYEDEFASVSETAEVPDQLNSASEAEIEDDAEPDIEIEDAKDDEYQSDDNYADDGFETSAAQVEETTTAAEPAGSPLGTDQFASGEEKEEQYSDEDFEQSEVHSNASHHKTEVSNISSASTEDSPPEVFNQMPAEDAHVVAENQAAHELSTIRSLSASELGEINNSSTIDQDQTVTKSSALAESISASLHEEDLATASMEEQIQRIDDLRRQIDLRKEAFAVVQKKLRVEKKKENLREAETQLWAEMELLESQLVADERILDLTYQRGRLESMALEAKHWSLQLGARGLTDLLADYDYCEPVESVKPVVSKQDHQAQVRVHDCHPAVATGAIDLDTTVHDLLLAFDHVEVAELSVRTVAINTYAEVKPRDISPPTIIVQPDILRAAGHEEEEKYEKCAARKPVERSVSQPEADLHQEEKATMPTKPVDTTANSAETQAAHVADLLSGYDYIETVLVGEAADDLLDGYDHLEEAEKPVAVGTMPQSDEEEPLQANIEVELDSAASELEVANHDSIPQEAADEEAKYLDESIVELEIDQAEEITLLIRANTLDVVTDIGGVGGGKPALSDVVELNSSRRDVPAEEAVENNSAVHVESENTDYQDIPDSVQFERTAPIYSMDEDELVARATENLLKALLHEAVADIRSVSARTATRRIMAESLLDDEPTGVPPPCVENAQVEKANIAGDADAKSVPDGEDDRKEEHEDLCHPALSFEATPSGHTIDRGDAEMSDEIGDERQSDLLVDCLFANLLAAAIQDSLRTEMKRRHIQFSTVNQDRQHQNLRESASTTTSDVTHKVRDPPPQSHRRIQEAIVNQLQVEAGQVTLPAFHECVSSDPSVHNARAIYDAVFNVASAVHGNLNRDPLFLNERNADKKNQLLLERVRREMEESIWCVQERARDELDRFARKLLEDEQGEVDQDDLRLLRAQQRTSSSIAMQALYQAAALRGQTSPTLALEDAITPRRRRLAVSTAQVSNPPGLAAQILAQEEERLAERIAQRMLRGLVESETAAIAR